MILKSNRLIIKCSVMSENWKRIDLINRIIEYLLQEFATLIVKQLIKIFILLYIRYLGLIFFKLVILLLALI